MGSIHFLLNKTLGKYKITEHIGNGGMAEVYLGQQINLERQVAVKVLHPFLAEDEGFVTRFKREARIVATLRHPNIVQVYDFDYNDEFEVYYMIMEYINGPTLKERLNSGPFEPKEAASVAAAIADALNYAHKRDMVHRDIKPANIMFTDDGQPVLTDFGIARMLSLTGLTASGAMVGTPAYMAPEIVTGQSGTSLSDIYSLGVVLYQIATGRLPFEAEIPMSLVMKHINEPVPPPTQFAQNITASLEAVILKALAKQPEARYESGAEMALALRQAMELEVPVSIGNNHKDTPLPASKRKKRKSQQKEEEEHPLLRTWPDKTESMADSTSKEKSRGKKSGQKTKRRLSLPRMIIILLLAALLGLVGWAAAEGRLPSSLDNILPLNWIAPAAMSTMETQPTATPTQKVTTTPPTVTPTLEATAAQEATAEVTPTCTFRAEILQIRTYPDEEIVPPDASLITYITLRNGGNCPWPEETHLTFTSGEEMNAPTVMTLKPLDVDEQIQILLPLKAPLEPAEYASTWEVHLPDGRPISSPIILTVKVGDLPAYTPTPLTEVAITPTPRAPLSINEPQILEWQVDEPAELWNGTLGISASGGTGTYRFYRDAIREETEISSEPLTFSWQRCEDLPLKIIGVSGDEVAIWEGMLPYPEPEQCEP